MEVQHRPYRGPAAWPGGHGQWGAIAVVSWGNGHFRVTGTAVGDSVGDSVARNIPGTVPVLVLAVCM